MLSDTDDSLDSLESLLSLLEDPLLPLLDDGADELLLEETLGSE